MALSANNAWAVGSYLGSQYNYQALIEHWDGARWSVVTHTHPGQYVVDSSLRGITAISTNDIWAVGSATRLTNKGEVYTTFTEHWDGSRWQGVYSPSPQWYLKGLISVAGISAGDIWTLGQYNNERVTRAVAEHWDGSHWNIVPTPKLQTSYILNGVAALSSTDNWAVGTLNYNLYNPKPQTLIEHWDGNSWTIVPSPNPQPVDELFGATVSPDHSLWAVGD